MFVSTAAVLLLVAATRASALPDSVAGSPPPASDEPSSRMKMMMVKRQTTYSSVYSPTTTTTSSSSSNQAYSGLVSSGYGNTTSTPCSTTTSTRRKHKHAHKTRITAWQPPGEMFFVNPDNMQKTQAVVTDGITVILATGTAALPGSNKPTQVADFKVYYKDGNHPEEMLEGLALMDKDGIPNEMVDALYCDTINGNNRGCTLYDFDGSTIGSSKATSISGRVATVTARVVGHHRDFMTQGAIPSQVSRVTYSGAYASAVPTSR